MKQDIDLSIYEYCAEDDTYTVHGELGYEPDLDKLVTAAQENYEKIIRMDYLDALVVVTEEATVHLHADGDVEINGVQSTEEAEELLTAILEGKK